MSFEQGSWVATASPVNREYRLAPRLHFLRYNRSMEPLAKPPYIPPVGALQFEVLIGPDGDRPRAKEEALSTNADGTGGEQADLLFSDFEGRTKRVWPEAFLGKSGAVWRSPFPNHWDMELGPLGEGWEFASRHYSVVCYEDKAAHVKIITQAEKEQKAFEVI